MINTRGYTLIELLLTLTLIGILLTLSISYYQTLKNQHLLETLTNRLINDIQFARNSALSLQKTITLCPSDDGTNCVSSSTRGWIIFFQTVNNNEVMHNIIRQFHLTAGCQIQWQGMGNQPNLQLNQQGNAQGHNGNFTVLINNKNNHLTRTIIISPTGRARLAAKD